MVVNATIAASKNENAVKEKLKPKHKRLSKPESDVDPKFTKVMGKGKGSVASNKCELIASGKKKKSKSASRKCSKVQVGDWGVAGKQRAQGRHDGP